MLTIFRRLPALLCLLLFAGCAPVPDYPVPLDHSVSRQFSAANHNGRVRFIVLHYTAGNWAESLQILTQPNQTQVSAHYLIPQRADNSYPAGEPLRIYQLLDEQQRAWHAGDSRWEDRQNLNDVSIGIELVNRGWCYPPDSPKPTAPLCLTPDFDPAQLELLAGLLRQLLARYPDVSPTRIVAHSDIAPARKQDPGSRFPWQWLASQGIGAWYDEQVVLAYWRALQRSDAKLPEIRLIQRALARYGYGIAVTGQFDEQTRLYLLAFQRHFVPDRVSGEADIVTIAVLWALLAKYFPDSLSGPDSLALPQLTAAPVQ